MAEKIEVGIKVVQVGAATKDIDSVDAKIKDLGSGFGLVQKAADKMTGGMASGMMAAYKSTKTFISGLKLTKAAMISTGIGALVVAVGALTVALATQGGELSLWNKATKGWKAGFKADINNVTVLGEAFGKLFTSGPSEALAHLTANFKDNFAEQQKAIASLEKYHASLGKLVDLQRQLVLDTASSSLEQYKLNQVVNDGTLSTDDRISAMKDLSVEEYNLIDAKEKALRLEMETIELKVLAGEIADGDLDRKIAITASLTRMMEERYKVNDKYTKGVRTLRTQEANHAKQESDRAIQAANEVRDAETAKKKAIEAAEEARKKALAATMEEGYKELQTAQERELDANFIKFERLITASMEHEDEVRANASMFREGEIERAIEHTEALIDAEAAKEKEINEKYRLAAAAVVEEAAAEDAEAQAKIAADKQAAKELADQKILDAELELAANLKAARADVQDAALASIEAVLQSQENAALSGARSEEHAEQISKKFAGRKRKLAIANVLLQQGQAVASAIAGAQAAAAALGPGAPIASPVFTAQMVGIVLSGFAGIKGIMNQAGAAMPEFDDVDTGGGGGGGGGGGSTQLALTPTLGSFGAGTLELPAVQAFIIQNDIADAATLQAEIQAQASL
tara:strand:- start:27 stop:1919 length:1893 start_codon:yes stop_codon:yes gene_type:complete